MSCSIHPNRSHVGICQECGRNLCKDCVERFNPPTCPQCVINTANEIIQSNKHKIILSIIIGIIASIPPLLSFNILGAVFFFLMCGGIPWGWSALNRITPRIFLILPIAGWVIYFFVKLVLSYIVGLFVMPAQLMKYSKYLKLVKIAKETLRVKA